jgi:hypothetical protein
MKPAPVVPPAIPVPARLGPVVATTPTDLYGLRRPCERCATEFYASADAGRTWQRRVDPALPDPDGPFAPSLVVLGEHALMWVQTAGGGPLVNGPRPVTRRWVTLDGGRTWSPRSVSATPVPAVADGARAVRCDPEAPASPCMFYALDPSDGRFAPLATQPSGLDPQWTGSEVNVPIGAGLWVPGLDAATRRPAVSISLDGGRTWHEHVFTDGIAAAGSRSGYDKYYPAVAAGSNGVAYVLILHDEGDDRRVTSYRTTDGGRTWARLGVLGFTFDPGYVTADGAHVVWASTGDGTGRLMASRGGRDYVPVTLPGFPAELAAGTPAILHDAAGRYLVGGWISDDGWKWRPLGS